MKRAIVLLAVGCLVAACGSVSERPRAQKLVYSPNGEPLNGGPLGRLTCREAMNAWFDRLASSGNTITHDAFMADAQRQFFTMDIDYNSALYSEELERYRAPYRVGLEPPDFGKKHEQSRERGPRAKQEEPSERLTAAIDPVMAADANNDFKVTPDEFRVHAETVFTDLDSHHKGTLSRDDVMVLCRGGER